MSVAGNNSICVKPANQLNTSRRKFQRQCAPGAAITLVGPLLENCPAWPDGPVIFVDGGAKWRALLPEDFRFPHLSLGDGDSLGDQQLDVLLDVEKDFSDLGYALDTLQPLSISRLTLTGFLGGRRDHEWINFGEVASFLQTRQQLRVDFGGEVALFAPGEYTLIYQGLFSLVHFTVAHTFIRGAVDYPLPQPTTIQPFSSHGLSNCAQGAFSIGSDAVVMCFFVG